MVKLMKNKEKHFFIGGALIFIVVSACEFILVILQEGINDYFYIGAALIFLILVIIIWKQVTRHLFSEVFEVLSKKYRLTYFGIVLMIVILMYMVLLYPLSPYFNSSDILLSFLPAFTGGLLGLISLTVYVDNDIRIRLNTGKSFWDSLTRSIKRLQGILIIELCLIFPIIALIGVLIGGFLFGMLKDIKLEPSVGFMITIFPVVGLLIGWMAVIFKTGKKIEREIHKITNVDSDCRS